MTFQDVVIDVSDAQASIDWPTVYKSGIRVAFIKAMEGSAIGYRTWKPQSIGADAAGIFVIPYIFLRPTPPETVITNFASVTGLKKGEPFALDWEGEASETEAPANVETIGLGLAKIAGRPPVGYWGNPGSTPAQPTTIMQSWRRWIPRYPQSPEPPNFAAMTVRNVAKKPPSALFWQYTSAGVVSGIKGPVDRSVFCGTADQLTAWLSTDAMPS